MEKEIKAAAAWWSSMLTKHLIHDNGDPVAFALSNYVRSKYPDPTPEQSEEFKKARGVSFDGGPQATLERVRQKSDIRCPFGVSLLRV